MRYLFFILLLASCGVSKKSMQKSFSQKEQSFEQTIDSLLSVKRTDSAHYENLLKESKTSGAVFDNKECPPVVNIDSACSKDSMIKVIRILQDELAQTKNSVEFYADGSFKATGKLKAAYLNASKLEKSILDLQSKYDSLYNVKQQVQTKEVTKTETKDVYVTRWRLSLLLIAIAFIVGCLFWNWKGGKIKQMFGKFSWT